MLFTTPQDLAFGSPFHHGGRFSSQKSSTATLLSLGERQLHIKHGSMKLVCATLLPAGGAAQQPTPALVPLQCMMLKFGRPTTLNSRMAIPLATMGAGSPRLLTRSHMQLTKEPNFTLFCIAPLPCCGYILNRRKFTLFSFISSFLPLPRILLFRLLELRGNNSLLVFPLYGKVLSRLRRQETAKILDFISDCII